MKAVLYIVYPLFTRSHESSDAEYTHFLFTPCAGSVGVGDEVPTYEEVVRLEPGQSPYRPIVLIGAPRMGRRTLIRELINSNPASFSTVVSREYPTTLVVRMLSRIIPL